MYIYTRFRCAHARALPREHSRASCFSQALCTLNDPCLSQPCTYSIGISKTPRVADVLPKNTKKPEVALPGILEKLRSAT